MRTSRASKDACSECKLTAEGLASILLTVLPRQISIVMRTCRASEGDSYRVEPLGTQDLAKKND
eukprot:scaffold22036_cov133-Skeletonema_dohrnii-CCMP3373.AAC.5